MGERLFGNLPSFSRNLILEGDSFTSFDTSVKVKVTTFRDLFTFKVCSSSPWKLNFRSSL